MNAIAIAYAYAIAPRRVAFDGKTTSSSSGC